MRIPTFGRSIPQKVGQRVDPGSADIRVPARYQAGVEEGARTAQLCSAHSGVVTPWVDAGRDDIGIRCQVVGTVEHLGMAAWSARRDFICLASAHGDRRCPTPSVRP